uniref:Protein kinase domain-containing protein n=1 Tax=Chromera velia CCMP2878 TaxID=1169474 RepID=A0A0G4GFA0_9ALVE|eukprot:Cvel_21626.t1-p1 / transcript=Cvel_21626.t1 / gene=Cvel_21626 / organism=Chromera_velia_CCMP2878 / gene_product=hypothetical protein / transcript_product=hypothetical protein / location=Cvel_scaffold2044:24754-26273(-) / protein_length=306 / sequence_SO=supercontig / SO=protein_coding / is_pseudo=false
MCARRFLLSTFFCVLFKDSQKLFASAREATEATECNPKCNSKITVSDRVQGCLRGLVLGEVQGQLSSPGSVVYSVKNADRLARTPEYVRYPTNDYVLTFRTLSQFGEYTKVHFQEEVCVLEHLTAQELTPALIDRWTCVQDSKEYGIFLQARHQAVYTTQFRDTDGRPCLPSENVQRAVIGSFERIIDAGVVHKMATDRSVLFDMGGTVRLTDFRRFTCKAPSASEQDRLFQLGFMVALLTRWLHPKYLFKSPGWHAKNLYQDVIEGIQTGTYVWGSHKVDGQKPVFTQMDASCKVAIRHGDVTVQ